MDQSLSVASNVLEFNCVRVQHIVKQMPDSENVMRHLDNIVNQLVEYVGRFHK